MVQMNRSTTVNMLVKSKIADCEGHVARGSITGRELADAGCHEYADLGWPCALTIAPSCPKRQALPLGARPAALGSAVQA